MEQLQASLQAVSDQKIRLEEDLQRQAEMVRRSVRTVLTGLTAHEHLGSWFVPHFFLSRVGDPRLPPCNIFQTSETQNLLHALEQQLQEQNQRNVDLERSSQEIQVQLEQQVGSVQPLPPESLILSPDSDLYFSAQTPWKQS